MNSINNSDNDNNNNINVNSINNNSDNNSNNNQTTINIRTSYDDIDFNNKDPSFFSSGNQYIYEGDEDNDEEYGEDGLGSFIEKQKKKKKRDDFLIDGFDENSEEMLTGGRGDKKKKGLFGYHKNGNKIMLFVGIVLLTFILCSVALVLYAGKHPKFINTDTNKVYPTIVISIDSFRAEYLERGLTPNLQKLIDDNSFRAQYTVAQFPSKTFPNHYSIATGLYPENHGIVSNHMYDPISGETFNAGSEGSFTTFWWWGEPIWVTAKKSNIKTACYFWPGCNIEGSTPDYNKSPFDMSITSSQIFNQTLQWRTGSLDKDFVIPTLTLAYVHEVDDAGHAFGPNSKQVNDSIIKMDTNIGILIDQLKESNLYDNTNIIFLSDHGMIEIPTSKYIYLDELVSDSSIASKFYTPDAIRHGNSEPSPIISIFPNDTRYSEDYLYDLFKGKTEFFDIYKKEGSKEEVIPDRFFFDSSSNSRIPPLLGVAKPGYSIIVSKDSLSKGTVEMGNHGYDPENGEMHSIFIARGPNIKSSGNQDSSSTTTLKEFKNTEIYNLLAQLIGIEEKHYAPTNGTSLLNNNIYKSSK